MSKKNFRRINEDSDFDSVLGVIAEVHGEYVPSDRAKAKSQGAITLIGETEENLPEETLAGQIEQKIVKFREIIDSETAQIYAGGELGEIVLDKNGNLVRLNMSPRAQLKIMIDYATTVAAISALYTSSPEVSLLPPEAFKINTFPDLLRQIDSNGVVFTVIGYKADTQTRFYTIPGKQLDGQRKPIPLADQKVLVVQDITLENGNIRRIYAVSTAADLDNDLGRMIKAQQGHSSDITRSSAQARIKNETPQSSVTEKRAVKNDETENPLGSGTSKPESIRKVLNAEKIRQDLERGVSLSELPAINILEHQIDANHQYILNKASQARRQDIAYSLAARLTRGVSLYQRISEQAVFGPKDFKRFDKSDVLAPLMPQIRAELAQAQQTITQKRPVVRFSEDNGWLYLHQGHKEETVYRIYLSPKPIATGKVFSDLATEIPDNVGYQMKTFDRPDRPQDVARLDKIIVYCSEDNFDTILGAVGRVYEQHMDDFQGRLGPGGGTVTPLEGVSVTKQPTQKPGQQENTGTQEVANRIKAKMDERLPVVTREGLQQYKTVQDAYQSDEGKFLWAAMSDGKENLVRLLYFPNNSVPIDQKYNLAQIYLETVYNATVRNYVEGRQVSISDIRKTFLRAVKARKIPLTDAQFGFLQNQSPYIYEKYYILNIIVGAARIAGLAIVFNNKLKAAQPPGEALREILSA